MTESSDCPGDEQRPRPGSSMATMATVMLVLLTGMTGYEFAKQSLFPGISLWTSHAVTIIFSTLVGSMTAYFVLRNYRNLNQRTLQELAERIRIQREHDQTISELRRALDGIKVLRGLIPICGSCKRIRDDEGYWNEIESYVRDHSEAEFNHSLCEVCAERLYPEYYAQLYPESH